MPPVHPHPPPDHAPQPTDPLLGHGQPATLRIIFKVTTPGGGELGGGGLYVKAG